MKSAARHIGIFIACFCFFAVASPAHAIYLQYFQWGNGSTAQTVNYGQSAIIRAHCMDQDGYKIYNYAVYGGYPDPYVWAGGGEDVNIWVTNAPGTYNYWFACHDNRTWNSVYAYSNYAITLTVNPAPTVAPATFTASPATLPNVNSGTTLTWTAGTAGTNFTGCTISGGQYSGTAVSISGGSLATNAVPAGSTTYTITCTDASYAPVTRSTTVTVGQPVTADATAPASILAGQTAIISLYADSATPPTQCGIFDSTGTTQLQNYPSACPSSASATFSRVLNTPGTYAYVFKYLQSAWVTVKTVTINVLPSCTLTPSAAQVQTSGSTVTLTYTASNANTASINQGVGTLAQTASTPQTTFVTSGTSWTVPLNWSNLGNNIIEVVGGGAGGTNGVAGAAGAYGGQYWAISGGAGGNGGAGGAGGTGGGGGAYSKSTNVSLTPGATVAMVIGQGGAAAQPGGDTYFCNSASNCASISGSAVVAGAKGGSVGGAGGVGTSGVANGSGAARYSGGGGAGPSNGGAGAAGGAPYPLYTGYPYNLNAGNGGAGGYGGTGGGGGGAAGSHGAGGNAPGMAGGTGDAGYTATGANGALASAYAGGGGSGNSGSGGGAGGTAAPYGSYSASNPGGAGTAGGAAVAGGYYGAGGGGGGGGSGGGGGGGNFYGTYYAQAAGGTGGAGGAGGAGRAGIIGITYTPYVVMNGATTSTPININPTVFTMTVTDSLSGLSNTCSATVAIQDVCSDITGFQASAPASPCVTPGTTPGQCVPSFYTWNGSACVLAQPSNLVLTGARVRKGNPAVLNYSMTNATGTCTITAPGYSPAAFAATASGSHTTTGYSINANTTFTLTCSGASVSATVGVLPAFIEQ